MPVPKKVPGTFFASNIGGPNLTDPLKFLSGIPGLYLPFGSKHHGIE